MVAAGDCVLLIDMGMHSMEWQQLCRWYSLLKSYLPFKASYLPLTPQVFDVTSGHEMTVLSQGHYDTVTACVYSPKTGHLWSTGLDGAVLAWSPWTQREQDVSAPSAHYMDAWLAAAAGGRGRQQLQQQQQGDEGSGSGGNRVSRTALPDVDFWSDDDELLVGV